MKNKLTDLNDHLFAQLERLGDEGRDPDDIKNEISRAKAIVSVGQTVVANARLALEAEQFIADTNGGKVKIPPMIGRDDGRV